MYQYLVILLLLAKLYSLLEWQLHPEIEISHEKDVIIKENAF